MAASQQQQLALVLQGFLMLVWLPWWSFWQLWAYLPTMLLWSLLLTGSCKLKMTKCINFFWLRRSFHSVVSLYFDINSCHFLSEWQEVIPLWCYMMTNPSLWLSQGSFPHCDQCSRRCLWCWDCGEAVWSRTRQDVVPVSCLPWALPWSLRSAHWWGVGETRTAQRRAHRCQEGGRTVWH